MNRLAIAGLVCLLVSVGAYADQTPSTNRTSTDLTLERIMADPDWIYHQIKIAEEFESSAGAPYFSVDGKAIYYNRKRDGSPIYDLHRIDLASRRDSLIDAKVMANADGDQTVYDTGNTFAAFVRNGDIFLRDLRNGTTTQITRTEQEESSPQFSTDGHRLSYRSRNNWYVYDMTNRVATPAAVLKTEKNPDEKPESDDLRYLQMHLFSTLRKLDSNQREQRKHEESMQRGDNTRAPLPFYFGTKLQIADTALSPDARWMLVVTQAKTYDHGKHGKLTRYVTDSGYADFEPVRVRVGRNPPAPQSLWLLDLAKHTRTEVAFDKLPGIHDDPLKAVREENAKTEVKNSKDAKPGHDKSKKSEKSDKPKTRDLRVADIEFARDGKRAAVELHAIDNKDRWIATLGLSDPELKTQDRLHDDAWINWSFNVFGWMHDDRAIWFESEETGYAQLYVKPLDGKAEALTRGKFEVSDPQLSADGRWFYMRSNKQAPYSYDVYRVPADGGNLQRITQFEGMDSFALSHDGSKLLVAHSTAYIPPQLAVVASDGRSAAHELTDTRTAVYKAMHWVQPEFVKVPSTHFHGGIWSKFYKPAVFDESKPHPAVLFVHGAGYTQDVKKNWSYYFREQMFHNLLLQHGYVVLDMDYRASKGYGRDWRTAIYRDMGHPELEDLLDGKRWLAKQWNVDPKRVGIYGGSYGGFMTLMAMFRAPGEFAAGGALRPVSDWTQYNDPYTSDILNRPDVDPIAYRRSSPIEFAKGLEGPLLICHGAIDNNVLFEDSMRLYERLIELHKNDFWISPYPLDRHGFTNADSWLDEYKRVYGLFQRTIGSKN